MQEYEYSWDYSSISFIQKKNDDSLSSVKSKSTTIAKALAIALQSFP